METAIAKSDRSINSDVYNPNRVYMSDNDVYLAEHRDRMEAGEVGPLDRANEELYAAEQAASIFLEGADDCDRAKILTDLAQVKEACRITASLDRLSKRPVDGAPRYGAQAEAMSHHCITLRRKLDEFDLGRLDKLNRFPNREAK